MAADDARRDAMTKAAAAELHGLLEENPDARFLAVYDVPHDGGDAADYDVHCGLTRDFDTAWRLVTSQCLTHGWIMRLSDMRHVAEVTRVGRRTRRARAASARKLH